MSLSRPSLRPSSSARPLFAPSLLALALAASLLPACGGNVIVDDSSSGGDGGNGGSSTTPVTCSPGLTLCGNQCVSIDSDPENCGGCGVQCPSGACFIGDCAVPVECPPNLVQCGNDCVDTAFDPQNCGDCGVVCPDGAECIGGDCSSGACLCGNICKWIDVGSNVPQTWQLDVEDFPDTTSQICGPTGWPDAPFLFTAPFDGIFQFVSGGAVDTVIQVMNTSCEPLLCTGSAAGDDFTVATTQLSAGEAVLVVVGLLGQKGDFFFTVEEVPPVDCLPCSEYISDGGPQLPICDDAVLLYDEIVGCICTGACSEECEAVCNGTGDFTQECQDCIPDSVNGCGQELDACLNDI